MTINEFKALAVDCDFVVRDNFIEVGDDGQVILVNESGSQLMASAIGLSVLFDDAKKGKSDKSIWLYNAGEFVGSICYVGVE